MKRNLQRLKVRNLHAGVSGDLSRVSGDLTGVRGDLSGISGDLTGIRGNLTGVRGELSECEITDDERLKGIDINDLIMIE